MFKRLGLGLLLTAALIGSAMGQQWPNIPLVNGASYCGSTVNGVCVQTVPAGPALTGNETIPLDTNVANGVSPQTAKIDVTSLGVGPYQYNAPVTTDSITVLANTRHLILEPAGTIAALTVVFPAASGLLDNQTFGLCTTQIVTTLTVTAGSGTTVSNAPTALLVPVATGGASCPEWVYRITNTTWYRVQ